MFFSFVHVIGNVNSLFSLIQQQKYSIIFLKLNLYNERDAAGTVHKTAIRAGHCLFFRLHGFDFFSSFFFLQGQQPQRGH